MGWYIALGLLVLLAILPLGASVCYDADGVLARVIAGPVRITLFPRKKKLSDKPKEKKKKKKPEPVKEAEQAPLPEPPPEPAKLPPSTQPQPKQKKGGSVLDFLPLLDVALNFLGDFRRKLRINRLELKLILGGDDPCDLATNYGKAWAALGNLWPRLERAFVIKKRDVEVECDFTSSETVVIARLDITITLGRLISLAVCYAVRALITFLKINKKRKGGAVK